VQVKKNGLRFSCIILFFLGCLIFFGVKLILIQVFRSSYLAKLAEKQHNQLIELEPVRGTIYDRKLRPLAINVSIYSIFANPKMMNDVDKIKAIRQLPPLLGIDAKTLEDRLYRNKYFVWIKRKVTNELVDQIKELDIHGLHFINESKRFYPNGFLAAHVIGFAGVDNNGLEGLELLWDKDLKGESGWSQVIRDARQRPLMIEKSYIPPKDGYNVILTIDETIQYITERALDRSFQKNKALSASVIVMDIKTGEILALANRPTYNLGEPGKSPTENRTNRAVTYVYEPGSVFKIVTASAALEEKAFTETDKIYCENGQYRVANHILHDHEKHGTLTFQGVIEQSSNIGTTKIAQKLGPDIIYKYGHKYRFGMLTGIDLQGEVRGLFKSPRQWSKTTIGAIPIGHEVTVTPLQLVCAISAIANNGVFMKPHIVKSIQDSSGQIIKSFEPQVVDRVISEETAQRVKNILIGVVENGTGKLAKIDGVKVGGKTGTAQKVINGNYSHDKFFASFIGFAPAENPKLGIVVVFDDPHPSHFGGTVSAPVFKEITENTLKYLASAGIL
jgi:cell division protein FtsI/penicillin-binding protein 2